MDIKKGEYVRTKSGQIGIFQKYEEEGIQQWFTMLQDRTFYTSATKAITKHSFNIIDLIEVGDYVNGYRILNMTDISNSDKTVFTIYKSDFKDICRIWGEEDIETILTHEQFEANCYKVKEQTNE